MNENLKLDNGILFYNETPFDGVLVAYYEAEKLKSKIEYVNGKKHGYEKQLEIYKDAAQTQYGIFVVIDYGRMGNKLREIQRIKSEREKRGERASDIIVIDAKPKKSASKRGLWRFA